MKYLIKAQKLILGVFLAVGLLSSCTKDFEEMNTNPNNPADVPAINIFTNAVFNSVDRQFGGWIQHTYLGPWSQQWTKIQYIDEDRYLPRDMSGDFNGPYTNELKNLTIVIAKATESGDDRLLAAAKIMRAYTFMHLTDMFGDIPYSEALQGLNADGVTKPVYDNQGDVYAALLVELEEANALIADASVLSFGSGDILYGGTPALWRRFANSLKLRILNRAAGTPWSFTYDMAGTQADVTTTAGAAALATADAQIAAILSNEDDYPIFTSNAHNAALKYPGLPYRNPIYNTLYSRTDQGVSETMVDWLEARVDPRLHVYAQPTPNSVDTPPIDYNGFQNGSSGLAAPMAAISLLGTKVAYTETAPGYMLCLDEVLFIQAEHYLRVGNDVGAQAAYEAGIVASMGKWGLTDGTNVNATWFDPEDGIQTITTPYPVSYATYLAHPLVAWGGTTAQKFQKICEQRWAAMFGQGVQAYHEIRRTGFPERIFEYELQATNYNNLGLPIRLPYANTEDTYNTDNLHAAKTAQHIEQANGGLFSTSGITSQMWWHTRKNPIPTEKDLPGK